MSTRLTKGQSEANFKRDYHRKLKPYKGHPRSSNLPKSDGGGSKYPPAYVAGKRK